MIESPLTLTSGHSMRRITHTFGALVAAVILTAACATNAPQVLADHQTAQHLLHDPPSHGFARLYLFDGRIIDGASDGPIAAHFRADELVDGVMVGSLNGGDVLVVDVPTGTHTLVWRERSAKAPMSKPLIVNVQSGQRLFVSNDYRMHSLATAPLMAFGAIGGGIAGAIGGAAAPMMAFGAIGGGIAGAAAADDGTADEPFGLMTIRSNGEAMIEDYDVVLPINPNSPLARKP